MTLFEIIRVIYSKKKLDIDSDTTTNMTLSKWLSFDRDNLECISKVLLFLFWVKPQHYIYLLWFNIPKKFNVPFLKKPSQENNEEENELFNKIKDVFNWSQREFFLYKPLLNKVILPNQEYWQEKLGFTNVIKN